MNKVIGQPLIGIQGNICNTSHPEALAWVGYLNGSVDTYVAPETDRQIVTMAPLSVAMSFIQLGEMYARRKVASFEKMSTVFPDAKPKRKRAIIAKFEKGLSSRYGEIRVSAIQHLKEHLKDVMLTSSVDDMTRRLQKIMRLTGSSHEQTSGQATSLVEEIFRTASSDFFVAFAPAARDFLQGDQDNPRLMGARLLARAVMELGEPKNLGIAADYIENLLGLLEDRSERIRIGSQGIIDNMFSILHLDRNLICCAGFFIKDCLDSAFHEKRYIGVRLADHAVPNMDSSDYYDYILKVMDRLDDEHEYISKAASDTVARAVIVNTRANGTNVYIDTLLERFNSWNPRTRSEFAKTLRLIRHGLNPENSARVSSVLEQYKSLFP